MPLDTGDIVIDERIRPTGDELATLRPSIVTLDLDGHVGEALAAARQSLKMDLEDIASATCVRRRYIQAIEAFEFEALPARPFVVGYVRAYARALGLDPGPVIERFKAEAPSIDDGLRPPVKLEAREPWGRRIVIGATSVLVGAVVVWNVWRHAQAEPLRPSAPERVAVAAPPPGPLQLGAPPPTPPEASTPPAYQTPGLASPDAQPAPPASAAAIGSAFVAAGPVYGAKGAGAGVVLQARASTPLVVRGPGGAIVFARQLAAGEAWRAASLDGMTADVGAPASVEVFVGGVSKGPLGAAQTALSKLAG
ncbi:MAG TPA: helix-turn-helix domain-containing protein [Caulobacteraceae bacterium]|jgi:transcriptional regulator with XRE-family HTH domain|nr:helix-turn-helix domain-containing protein [Caulobacteraceae bacterium]